MRRPAGDYELLLPFEKRPNWLQQNKKWLLGFAVVVLLGYIGFLGVHNTSGDQVNLTMEASPTVNYFPKNALRAGCQASGLYNRERHSNTLKKEDTSGWTVDSDGVAKFGVHTTYTREEMEKACELAGFYDPGF